MTTISPDSSFHFSTGTGVGWDAAMVGFGFIWKSRGEPSESEAIVGRGPKKLLDDIRLGEGRREGNTYDSSSLCQLIESFPSA